MIGNVPVEVAAYVMDKSPLWVREAIDRGILDIGCCMKGEHGRRSYYISPQKLKELTGYEWDGTKEIKR